MNKQRQDRGPGAAAALAAAALLLTCMALAAGPEAPAASELRGLVSWSDGRPAPGARVRVYGADTRASAGATRWIAEATTDRDGSFAVAGLEAGPYSLTASAAKAALQGRRGVSVARGRTTHIGTIRLGGGGVALRGRAVDVDGRGLAGATITLIDGGGAGTPDPPLVFEASADAGGRYEMQMRPGYYSVEAAVAGIAYSERGWIHLGADRVRDVVLRAACRMEGRAAERTGNPVAGAQIEAQERSTGRKVQARSSSDGSFRLEGVAPGVYDVIGHHETLTGVARQVPVSCLADDPRLALSFDKAATLKVQARDGAGRTPAGLTGTLFRTDAPTRAFSPASTEGGVVEFRGVPVGEYRVVVEAPGYAPFRQAVSVPIPGFGMQTEVTLDREATVSGRVRRRDGTPAGSANVRALVVLSPNRAGEAVAVDSTTDAQGRFELRGLPAGTAVVAAVSEDLGAATRIELKETEGKTIDLELGPVTAVSGRVRYPDGRPAAGVRLETLPPETEDISIWPAGFAITEPDGTYRLGPLDPGDTYVAAARAGFMSFDLTGAAAPGQRRLQLAPGAEVPSVELTVAPGDGRLSGAVADGEGRGIAGARVTAYYTREGYPGETDRAASTMSLPDGRFVLEDLEAGALLVRASHPAFAEAESPGVRSGGAPVSLVLRPGAVVRGRLEGLHGTGLADCTVDLLPLPLARETSADTSARRMRSIQERRRSCEDRGQFELRGVPSGDYELRVTTSEGIASRPLHLEDGRSEDVVLAPGSGLVRLTGTVVAHTGRGVEHAELRLQAAGWPGADVTTDGEGRFSVFIPPDPAVRITVSSPGTFLRPERIVIRAHAGSTAIDVGTIRLSDGS